MRASPEAIALALALTASPALAQLGPPPPEYYAQQNGAAECGRPRGGQPAATIIGAFRNDGPTRVEGVESTFEFEICFRAIEACERFVVEMRLDYPRGVGGCRPAE